MNNTETSSDIFSDWKIESIYEQDLEDIIDGERTQGHHLTTFELIDYLEYRGLRLDRIRQV